MQSHRELNKYEMGVLSDNVTAGFFISFVMTVFVLDIEGIQNKEYGYELEQLVQ